MVKVGMISVYPPKASTHSGPVEAYAKNLATSIVPNNQDVNLIIFADKLDNKGDEYIENSIKVVRCWSRGFFYWLHIFREVLRRKGEVDAIHVQHEYFIFGNILTAALFPFMLLLLKFLRKPIIITLHGVVPLSGLNATFARENNLKGDPSILKLGLWIVTRAISYLAKKVIVHEDYLGNVLVTEYGIKKEKITVIHLGIEEGNVSIKQEMSKETLGVKGKKVVMFFGFLGGYKGLDILIDAFGNIADNDYTLLIVGGENPRKQRDREYKEYIQYLKDNAAIISNGIRFTGFIPEEEIPLYFSAADVVVLPYTTVMSSSLPLALCIAYKRPFLLSEPFKVIISDEDLLFKNNPEALKNKIEEFFSDKGLKEKSLKYGEMLFQERSWTKVGCDTAKLYRELTIR